MCANYRFPQMRNHSAGFFCVQMDFRDALIKAKRIKLSRVSMLV